MLAAEKSNVLSPHLAPDLFLQRAQAIAKAFGFLGNGVFSISRGLLMLRCGSCSETRFVNAETCFSQGPVHGISGVLQTIS
jgi:hypothetical protein